ncbi:nucleoside triphosphate pyrophosphohydrolase [Alphaproteobacteria bacterium]|nr:nucleoside triphosphate pyrophosphohydrolase [Alphaproteobacteria bacterium]
MTDTKKLEEVIKKLRNPNEGCPWDINQTSTSLLPYLIEEAYEVVDAIKNKDTNEIKEELGDLLLQILLHSTIQEENNAFNLQDVIDILCEKLIRRHPHVFKTKKKLTNKELKVQWEKIKIKEGKIKDEDNPFYKINKSQPSLLQALDISMVSKDFKFDWDDYKGPLDKVKEELNEVIEEKEKDNSNQLNIEEEIGDLLFSIVNLSRHLKINPEIALLNANNKFIKRFNLMLQQYDNKEEFIKTELKSKEKSWQKIKKL